MENYIIQAQQEGKIRSDLSPTQLFRIIVGSMRFTVTQWNLSDGAFDLKKEGSELIETIIKLIETKQ